MEQSRLMEVLVASAIRRDSSGQTPRRIAYSDSTARHWRRRHRAFIIDIGLGVVPRAAFAAAIGTKAAAPSNIKVAFVTHLHYDHTVGYPGLIPTPWVVARKDGFASRCLSIMQGVRGRMDPSVATSIS